jgi:DNA-binding NtrC family response regulator
MKKPKILIADDDRSITEGLGAILSDEGYEIEVALDGQKAMDRLTSDAFGVALADLMMPKLDGLALLKEMQARGVATECIIVTGQATVDSAVQAMRQGAYDYIEKPLNAEKLNRLKALIPKALDKFNDRQKIKELASTIEGLTHYGELTGAIRIDAIGLSRHRRGGTVIGERADPRRVRDGERARRSRDSQQERSRQGNDLRTKLRRAPQGHSRE